MTAEDKKTQAGVDLYKYLRAHESDIAYEIDDFGDLTVLFQVVMDREPIP